MALTTTTLSSAVAVTDTTIVVASATGFAAGSVIRIDDETLYVTKAYVSGTTINVTRGEDGTVTAVHPVTANVTVGLATDFSTPGPGGPTVTQQAQKDRVLVSYSASGAIAIPAANVDTVACLNGTGALAMTLANPTKDMDGTILYIIANGKAAHTVTYTAGVGNGGATMDVGTFNATEATGCALMAMNGFWILWANGVGAATGQVAGVVWG